MKKVNIHLRNRFNLTIVPLVLMVLLFPFNGLSQEPGLKLQLKPGPYAVGFKAVNNYDYSRTYYSTYDITGDKVTQKARPIQTSIWYPADAAKMAKAKPMIFFEYAYLMAHELGYRKLSEAVKKETLRDFHLFFSTSAAKRGELETTTHAVRDAEPAEGSFPLVIYGPSINAVSFENSVLFEYLASHGYIVVSSPNVGKTTRYVKADLSGTETQARDMLFLLSYMQDFPGVDHGKIAVMGFSWGGMSNVLAAMRDSRIRAVICLDGSIAYNKYFDEMVTKSLHYNLDKITMPLLFMRSKKIPDDIMKKFGALPQSNVTFYDKLKYSDACFLRFSHMMHGDFSSTFLTFLDMKDPNNLASSREQVHRSYNLVVKYVHSFLDAYLHGKADALQYMSNTPGENGIAGGVITKRFKKALKREPSFGRFISKVKNAGFDKIAAVYGEIKKEFPQYTLSEDLLTDLAFLMYAREKQGEDVLRLLKFTLDNHPRSYYSYYGLAEIYAAKGDKKAAVDALNKAMELNPRFRLAEKKLNQLKGEK
ncbi:MAG: alpha/beta hydrolase [bacterium]|nr:alpha/beta hydrolase [bacterium]